MLTFVLSEPITSGQLQVNDIQLEMLGCRIFDTRSVLGSVSLSYTDVNSVFI